MSAMIWAAATYRPKMSRMPWTQISPQAAVACWMRQIKGRNTVSSSDFSPAPRPPCHSHLNPLFIVCFQVLKPEELPEALLPTLEKMYRQYPESVPFLHPVNPYALGLSDYFDIVRKPMDLSTIRHKLEMAKYSDPWEYVDDVWLMFYNAWLYNQKTSRVYRYCTRVCISFLLVKLRSHVSNISMLHFRLLHYTCQIIIDVLFVHYFSFPFEPQNSCRKYSNRKSIQLCKHLAIAAAENTLSIRRCCAATASNCVPFHRMQNTTAIKIATHSVRSASMKYPAMRSPWETTQCNRKRKIFCINK